jgi:hypothetical protein
MSTTTYALCPSCGQKIEGGFRHGCAPIYLSTGPGFPQDKLCECGHWISHHSYMTEGGLGRIAYCLHKDCFCPTNMDKDMAERVRYWKKKLDEESL